MKNNLPDERKNVRTTMIKCQDAFVMSGLVFKILKNLLDNILTSSTVARFKYTDEVHIFII